MVEIGVPLQLKISVGSFTVGVGNTVSVNVVGLPVHVSPFSITFGSTVIVAVIGAVVEFIAVNGTILPLPDEARPMAVLLFVQVNVVPEIPPENE
jgi:hypothetical protein